MPTSTGLPTTPKLEIEFTAGVWTDVSADVDVRLSPLQIRVGRSSPYSQPQVATMTVSLFDPTGKYIPKRQVLADGVTPNTLYPNIQPRKRIRWSYVASAVQRVRFLGYIKSWTPQLVGGKYQVTVIQASDRLDQLSRTVMQSPITVETAADDPSRFWPLTDASADTAMNQTAADSAGGSPLRVAARSQQALNFGDNGPGFGDGSGVRFSPGSASSGQFLYGSLAGLDLTAFTISLWVNCGTTLPTWMTGTQKGIILGVDRARDAAFQGSVGVISNGRVYFKSGQSIQSTTSIVDGGWHHIAVTRATAGGACTLYVDGVSQGASLSSMSTIDMDAVTVGEAAIIGRPFGASRFQGNVGYVAVYDYALSSPRIQAQATAGDSYFGDTVDVRIKRYLGIAGLTSTDWLIDASTVTVGRYPQAGKDVLSACQDMATTEGGGGAFYVLPAGQARFANRRYRDSRTPVITLNAVNDILDTGWAPVYDETITNSVTVDRSAESGSLSSQTWTDSASEAQYGVFTDQVATYTTSDTDALNLAQWEVAGNSRPAYRIPQITVDLVAVFMGAGHDLYGAVADVQIGSRLRVTNLSPDASPVASVDLFAEGWTETYGVNSYRVVFDASPVEYRWQWDTSRWAPERGALTLNALITRTATTLALATPGPTCSTSAGSYPVTIRIGEEDITLNSVPGGSTSPQTFVGVTRGANGTLPAAQAAGSVVGISPPDGWSL